MASDHLNPATPPGSPPVTTPPGAPGREATPVAILPMALAAKVSDRADKLDAIIADLRGEASAARSIASGIRRHVAHDWAGMEARIAMLERERDAACRERDRLGGLLEASGGTGEAGAATAERERITGLFDSWIEILMAEPNAHPPSAWKAAFAELVSPARAGLEASDGR